MKKILLLSLLFIPLFSNGQLYDPTKPDTTKREVCSLEIVPNKELFKQRIYRYNKYREKDSLNCILPYDWFSGYTARHGLLTTTLHNSYVLEKRCKRLENELNNLKKKSNFGVITLQDLQNYQQECYKDTCWVTYDQWYQDRISCKLGDGDYEIVKERYDLELQRTLFLVRRTPTFDGFVKYLEE